MLIISLVFSLVMLVSFDSLSAAFLASSTWALFSLALFATSAI